MGTEKKDKQVTFNTWIAEAIAVQMNLKRRPQGIDALHAALLAKLPKHLSAKKDETTKTRIFEELDVLFWKGRTNLLRDASMRNELSAEKLYEILRLHRRKDETLPPQWVVETKFREMHGRTSAPHKEITTLRGVLRMPLKEAADRTFIKTSFAEPFHALPKSQEDQLKIAVISAPQLGLPYDLDIYRNLMRSGLSAARKMHCDAVVIGGGIFHIPLKMGGGTSRFLNSLASGVKMDPKSISSEYREEAKRIMESDELVPLFITALERFNNLLDGLHKVAVRPDGQPEFEGPIYIVSGPTDFDFILGASCREYGYEQKLRLLKAQAHARFTAKIADTAFKNLEQARQDDDSTEDAEEAYKNATKEFEEAAANETRIRVSNYDDVQNKKVIARATSYFAAQIEKHLPNATFVDHNRAYLRFGKSKQILKFFSGGNTANPHYEHLENYGPAQRRGELPALTVVMHPRAISPRETSREDYREGSMILRSPGGFFEAPMLVDREPILAATNGNRTSVPAVAAVSDSRFAGGMLTLSIDPELGINPDFVPAEAVRSIGAPRRGRPAAPAECFYFMVATDLHFGGSMRVKLRRPSGVAIGLPEAGFELMQRSLDRGMAPVCGLIVADDILHGNHFGTHKRPHFHEKSNARVLAETEQRLTAIRGLRNADLIQKEYLDLTRNLADQIDARTVHYLTAQFTEMLDSWLFPYRDVCKGILLRAEKSGVVVKGVSQFTPGFDFDMRDIGLINFGSGNHATKTTEEMLHEGVIVRDYLRLMFSADPDLAGLDLNRLIQAPLLQDRTIGYGTVKAGNGYEYGIEIVGSPPKRDSWHDVLHGWPVVKRHTGNPSTILEGKATLHVTGDKHFFASHYAANDIFVMGPSATHTDAFAYMAGGLAENTSGLAFVGLPVDGPDSGAITAVHLTPRVMQDFISTPEREFPWDRFLPNSIDLLVPSPPPASSEAGFSLALRSSHRA